MQGFSTGIAYSSAVAAMASSARTSRSGGALTPTPGMRRGLAQNHEGTAVFPREVEGAELLIVRDEAEHELGSALLGGAISSGFECARHHREALQLASPQGILGGPSDKHT
jgi:hypothetical protein